MYRFQISLGDEPRNRIVANGWLPSGAVRMDATAIPSAQRTRPPILQWIEASAYGVGDSWGHVTCRGDGVQRLAGNC